MQSQAARLGGADYAALEEVVGEGDCGAGADGVQAVGIAEVAQLGDGGEVVNEQQGAQSSNGLILWPLGFR